ncbi:hypothetical protein [Aequorivita echinoideorum]|uniref:Uncharacterized protein n=1 Tax=Aequorivita echinoideorum TaxID=1549647 RepID=A0ABS5S321_9FLAO|nr:hypothetical protein [Aequorivita echinoideorum]MBT0607613.1 hypothetical protein [Aequorivita echinoideorum]
MAHLTAEALFPAFLAMAEEERAAFLKMGAATINKKDKPKRTKKTVYDKVCEKLGEQFRPGNEEMLISQLMHEK